MSGNDDEYAKRAERAEAERRRKIETGTASVRQMFDTTFNPGYFKKISTDFQNYYSPQLEKQVGDSQSSLTGALARSGNLGGMRMEFGEDGRPTGNYVERRGLGGNSLAQDKFADLQEQHNIKRTELVDRANQAANTRRTEVQQAKEGVIMQLQSTADASGATADAAARATSLNTPVPYEPLGQLFTDATYGLATQADLERRGQARYNTGLFPQETGSSGETVG